MKNVDILNKLYAIFKWVFWIGVVSFISYINIAIFAVASNHNATEKLLALPFIVRVADYIFILVALFLMMRIRKAKFWIWYLVIGILVTQAGSKYVEIFHLLAIATGVQAVFLLWVALPALMLGLFIFLIAIFHIVTIKEKPKSVSSGKHRKSQWIIYFILLLHTFAYTYLNYSMLWLGVGLIIAVVLIWFMVKDGYNPIKLVM